jgi:hypothetical protein
MKTLSLKRIHLQISLGLVLLAFLQVGCTAQPKTVEEILKGISAIDSLKRIDGDTLFAQSWELWFSQPVDHKKPKGERFPQRVIYKHKDFGKPMVIAIEGYSIYSSRSTEPTKLLDANQIIIEHRFFEKSRPKDSIPWGYLNIYQAATDQHKIIQAFKPFYKNKWVSTGISKGGQATIYHRYFYPKDVDVSIPYVAPLNFSSEDERVYTFLENVGTPECRQRVRDFQEQLFKRKKSIMPKVEELAKSGGYTFQFGLERAYDINVLEYSFAYWQWSGLSCEQIPQASATDTELFNHWIRVASFDFIEDKGVDVIRPFFYQAMTEIGMYGYEVEPWREYLSDTTNITFDFTMPKGHKAVFNPESMQKVNQWVQQKGNYMLYIYGEYDPWSATAAMPTSKTNAAVFINPGGDHTTRIKSFPSQMQQEIYSTLENWLDQTLNR